MQTTKLLAHLCVGRGRVEIEMNFFTRFPRWVVDSRNFDPGFRTPPANINSRCGLDGISFWLADLDDKAEPEFAVLVNELPSFSQPSSGCCRLCSTQKLRSKRPRVSLSRIEIRAGRNLRFNARRFSI
jgi:hypothetical protein